MLNVRLESHACPFGCVTCRKLLKICWFNAFETAGVSVPNGGSLRGLSHGPVDLLCFPAWRKRCGQGILVQMRGAAASLSFSGAGETYAVPE